MTPEKKNPAIAVARDTGLGIFDRWDAVDARVSTPSLAEVQTIFLARRHGLAASYARAVVPLLFGEERR